MQNGARERRPSERELRWFGLSALAALGVLGAVVFWIFDSPRAASALLCLGAALALTHALLPPLRRPLYDVWMAALSPVAWVVSHAALGLIYFGILTPLGLVMRTFGRDTLALRPREAGAAETSSRWVARPTDADPERYLRQS